MKQSRNVSYGETNRAYFATDPSTGMRDEQLHCYLKDLQPYTQDDPTILKANLYYELAMQAKVRQERSSHLNRMSRLLNSRSSRHSGTINSHNARMLRTHIPLLKDVWSPEALETYDEEVLQILRGDTKRYAKTTNEGIRGLLRGRATEQLVSLLLNHTPGVRARPTFARQDETTTLVEGKKYQWDVTAESDGQVLPTGDYLTQVKSKDSKSYLYHPEIVPVHARSIFRFSADDAIAFIHFAELVVEAGTPDAVPEVDAAHTRLMVAMALHGPLH